MKLSRYFLSLAVALSTYTVPLGTSVFTSPFTFAQDKTDSFKWTDISGSRTIDAKFVRLEGDSVVLEKADGSEVTVPLNKLNLKSQAQAKRLANPKAFEKPASSSGTMKPSAAGEKPADSQPSSASSSDAAKDTSTNRVKLPQGITAAETLKTIIEELKKENYGILIDTMSPEQIQVIKDLTSTAATKLNKSSFDSIKSLLKRSAKVMGGKKEFVMNYPKLPSEVKPRLSAHYDTVVELLNDMVASPIADYKVWTDGDTDKFLPVVMRLGDVYGAKFIATEKKLDPSTAANMNSFIALWGAPISREAVMTGKVRIINENGDQAQLEYTGLSGATESINLERVQGRWQAVETEITRNALQMQQQQLAQVQAVDPAQISGQLTLGLAVVGGLIGQLDRANSQEEFNQQMDQLMQAAGQMVPGAGPGVPGLPPIGP
jgi:hypothetical protein